MAQRDAGQSREAILRAIEYTGMSRDAVAESLGVHKASVDRWVSRGRISAQIWGDLLTLGGKHPDSLKALADCSLDEIVVEIERRGWSITLVRRET